MTRFKRSAAGLMIALALALCGCKTSTSSNAVDTSARSADLLTPRETGPAPAPFVHRDVNHVLSAGQSLAIGYNGAPVLSVSQPYANVSFNTGVLAGGAGLTGFVPLVERSEESMASGMANLITRAAREEIFKGRPAPGNTHDVLVSCHGQNQAAHDVLKKGSSSYADGMAQVRAAKKISAARGLSYAVRAVTLVHGESDQVDDNRGYGADLVTWQADYEADIRAITGQKLAVPMLHSQISNWTKLPGTPATSFIPGAQLDASVRNPGKIMLVGPKYFLPYSDGVHLSNKGYRRMGEYYAKVYRRVVLEGGAWEPLRPIKASLSGAVIRVSFAVPSPPLVLDTALVKDPGGRGFEYRDDSGSPPKVVSVRLDGSAAVKITLSRAPTGKSRRIRYAHTGKPGAGAGPETGPRGNLRDSDAAVSRHGYRLHNWAVHFDLALP